MDYKPFLRHSFSEDVTLAYLNFSPEDTYECKSNTKIKLT